MDIIKVIFESLPTILPSLLLGAAVPLAVILCLSFSKARKNLSYSAVFYGIATFFASLALVAVLLITVAPLLVGSISISDQGTGNRVVTLGGCLILLVFYLFSELLRFFSYSTALKKEGKNRFVGFLFGSGFILAQNLLVLGLTYTGAFTLGQAIGFGVLMLICGVIYVLASEIAYQVMVDGYKYVGNAIAFAYYLLLASMLIFANVVVTYLVTALVLGFMLVMAYVLLPHPFKKKGGQVS